jgi:ATP-dependent Lon protease
LKEKVLAAHRAGITHVLIPEENAKDIHDIPAMILKVVKIETVEHMDQVLRKALVLDNPERFLMKPEAQLAPASLYPSEPSLPPPTSSEIVTH